MVTPNNEEKERHSVDELNIYAQGIHLALVDWASTPAERTGVIAFLGRSESTLQAYTFMGHGGAEQ